MTEKRITLRLTMSERTYDLLWDALTNHQDTVREGDQFSGDAQRGDYAKYERLMQSVMRQKNASK